MTEKKEIHANFEDTEVNARMNNRAFVANPFNRSSLTIKERNGGQIYHDEITHDRLRLAKIPEDPNQTDIFEVFKTENGNVELKSTIDLKDFDSLTPEMLIAIAATKMNDSKPDKHQRLAIRLLELATILSTDGEKLKAVIENQDKEDKDVNIVIENLLFLAALSGSINDLFNQFLPLDSPENEGLIDSLNAVRDYIGNGVNASKIEEVGNANSLCAATVVTLTRSQGFNTLLDSAEQYTEEMMEEAGVEVTQKEMAKQNGSNQGDMDTLSIDSESKQLS